MKEKKQSIEVREIHNYIPKINIKPKTITKIASIRIIGANKIERKSMIIY